MSKGRRFKMRSILVSISLALMIVCGLTASAFGQGRGRGNGLGRKSDVFVNSHDARDGLRDGLLVTRSRNQSWKCSVFVNCHDARDGRLDGRGPNRSAFNRNRNVARGNTVGYRRRYDMNDYWQRRHVTSGTSLNRWRYRNGTWRNR